MSSVQEEKPAEKPRVPELRNAELVSRLLAATPPYLYSALPLQPHAYFFSEMLRSFVQARHGCRAPLPHPSRRLKKRGPKYFAGDDLKADWQRRVCDSWKVAPHEEKIEAEEPEPLRAGDIPLELTVDKHPRRPRDVSPRRLSPKIDRPKSSGSPGPPGRYLDVGVDDGLPKPAPCLRTLPADPNLPQANLILPPPPPMWYPPLYTPPFGMDPLNFFIDLRVSGHIYDRKRAAGEAGIAPEVPVVPDKRHDIGAIISGDRRHLPGHRPRHASAFSVPTRTSQEPTIKYFDRTSGNSEGTPYVMRNLKRIYETLKVKSAEEKMAAEEEGTAAKAEASDFTDVDEDVAQN